MTVKTHCKFRFLPGLSADGTTAQWKKPNAGVDWERETMSSGIYRNGKEEADGLGSKCNRDMKINANGTAVNHRE